MKCRSMLGAVVILIAGCASAVPKVAGSSEILFDIQGKTYDEVWSAIERVAEQNLNIVEMNKGSGLLKATKGVVMGPWGNMVEFSVRPAHNGASDYSVELVSVSQPDSRLPTADWANTMVNRIKSELDQ